MKYIKEFKEIPYKVQCIKELRKHIISYPNSPLMQTLFLIGELKEDFISFLNSLENKYKNED